MRHSAHMQVYVGVNAPRCKVADCLEVKDAGVVDEEVWMKPLSIKICHHLVGGISLSQVKLHSMD